MALTQRTTPSSIFDFIARPLRWILSRISVLQLTHEDKEVSFTTQLGRLEVKTRFNLKDMMYRKELALWNGRHFVQFRCV